MASRLGGFKLKPSSSKKTSSPNGSHSSTPTNSQSSMGGTADKAELTIDEPLQGKEIESLKIKEEELKKVIIFEQVNLLS